VPQWEDDNEMLRQDDSVSSLDEGLEELIALEILLYAQDREIEARYFDPGDLVAGDRSTLRIGIGKCVAEGACRLDRDGLGQISVRTPTWNRL